MKSFQKAALFCFSFVIFGTILVLIGWHFQITILQTMIAGLVSMKANTAVSLMLLAIGSIALSSFPVKRWRRLLASGIAIVIFIFSFSTLIEYLLGFNFGIDEFFYLDPAAKQTLWPPGRPAPVTLFNFILISLAMLLDSTQKEKTRRIQQALIVVASIVSFQAFVGYCMGVSYTFGSAFYTQIAIHTSLCFIFLCVGILLSRPRVGFMVSLLGGAIAGRVGRTLLLTAVIIPPLINWIQMQGVKLHYWDEDFGFLLRVLVNVAFFSWIAFRTSLELHLSEENRDQAEFRLRESEARFRFMADGMPQIVWMATPAGQITYVSKQWREFTGRYDQKRREKSWAEAIHPDDVRSSTEAWDESIRTETDHEVEFRLRRQDGVYRHSLVKGRPIRDEKGQMLYWLGTITDIHDQKVQTEDQSFLAEAGKLLSESLDPVQTLDRLVEVAREHFGGWCQVHLMDEHTRRINLVAVSHADPKMEELSFQLNRNSPQYYGGTSGAARILTAGKPEWVASMTEEILHQASPDPVWEGLVKKLNVKSYISVPLVIRGKHQGLLTLISSERAYTAEEFRLTQELATRCTFALDNAHLYQEMKRALQARTDLMSVASHEIKTPLTSLKLQAETMRRNFERGDPNAFSRERIAKLVKVNDRQISRLVRLVEEMLDFTRIEQGKFDLKLEALDLAEVMKTVIDEFTDQFEHAGVLPEVQLSSCTGQFDRFRIEQAFSNLLVNAIRYGKNAPILIRLEKTDPQHFQISVKDQGLGVAPENKERIFDRFERAISRNDVSGLGLGLFITRTIVNAHQGRVWVESEGEGKGSRFVIELPAGDALLQDGHE